MADDIAKLGFSIDTTPLQRATMQAQAATVQIGKLGDAADKVSKQSAPALTAQVGRATQAIGQNKQQTDFLTQATLAWAVASRRAGDLMGGIGNTLVSTGTKVSRVTQQVSLLSSSLGHGGGAAGAGLARILPVLTGSLAGLGLAFGGATVAIGGFAVVAASAIVPLAVLQDKYATYESRLKNALGSQEAANRAFSQLAEMSYSAGIGLDSTIDAFTRLARSADQIGATTAQVTDLTETIQKLGIVSGASQGEVASGMLQLSQALASGRLNGDELRSIMENMPALARAIADGLGVGVGELRRMGAAGELVSDKVLTAILSQTQKARKEFETMPDTVERSWQRMTDAAGGYLARLGEILHASQIVRGVLNGLAETYRFGSKGIDAAENLLKGSAGRQAAAVDQGLIDMAMALGEQQRIRSATVARGVAKATELDDIGKKSKENAENMRLFTDAMKSLDAQFANGEVSVEVYTNTMERLRLMMAAAKQEAVENISAFDKFKTSVQESAEAMNGRRGGAIGFYQQFQKVRDQNIKQGRGSVSFDEFATLASQDAAAKSADQIQALERQAQAQDRLAAATGRGAASVKQAEIAQKVLEFRISKFGDIVNEYTEPAVRAYEQALWRVERATEAVSVANDTRRTDQQVNLLTKQAEAQSKGAYAIAEAEKNARIEAAALDYSAGMRGKVIENINREFAARNKLNAAVAEANLLARIEDNRAMTAAVRSGVPGAEREAGLLARIKGETKGLAPGDRDRVSQQIRDEANSSRDLEVARTTAALRRQADLVKEELRLVNATTEERSVQVALYQQKLALLEQGVDLGSREAQDQLRVTEELARGNAALERRREEAEDTKRVWTNAADTIQNDLGNAFESVFSNAENRSYRFADTIGRLLRSIAADMMAAAVFNPLKRAGGEFLSDAFSGAGSWLSGLFGGGAVTSSMAGHMSAMGGMEGMISSGFFFRNGGIMTPRGPMPLRTYSRGGIANSPQVAVFGEGDTNEAYVPLPDGNRIPVALQGNAGAGPVISIEVNVTAPAGMNDRNAVSNGRRFGESISREIRAVIQDELGRQQRDGGMLSKGINQ